MSRQQGSVIEGGPVETAVSVPVYDPSTGEVFAHTPDCGPEEVGRAVDAAARAAVGWRRRPVAVRAAVLRRIGIGLLEAIDRLGELEARQTGKPLRQARRDIEISARYFDFYASAIETFGGATVPLDDDTLIYTRWEPHGVTAHITPWNYPLSILSRSVAPSLAMGNGCVLKPAEEAPLTAALLVDIADAAGLPTGLLNVVTGYGETAGAALTAHPGIGHISFTGSVEVGRVIGRVAAERIVPVTMELGGKSPNIVFADADLDRAVPIIVNSILQMAGQTCSAGARLLVHEDVHAAVVERIVAAFEQVVVGPALDDPGLGPLVSEVQRGRVLGYFDWARTSGARVLTGGSALSGGVYGDGYFVQPTVIDGVDPADRLAQEEIFGPVLAVTAFRTVEEAIELANGTDYGLVAGVWTTDLSTAHRMVQGVDTGQVFVNSYGASGGVELPFGGMKNSGFGREKGVEGLRGFGRLKTAVVAL
jgi:aldehyde dehydrogenase (NAD+)/betaine-aldehyde dehydrogenase